MSNRSAFLAGTAFALLGLAACGQQGNQATGTNAAGLNSDTTEDTGAVGATAVNETTAADPGAESANGSTPAPVAVVTPPAPAPDLPPAAAAPLAEAATITQTIVQGSGVERIPYQGGWAWRRDGHIVRIASADGRRVSYFRPGETTPFLVQQDKRAVAFNHGAVERAYTPQGRPEPADSSTRKNGEQLARQAVQDRTRATQVATAQPAKVQKERPSRAKPAPATQTANSRRNDAQAPAGKPAADQSGHDGKHDTHGAKPSTDDQKAHRGRSEQNNQSDAAH